MSIQRNPRVPLPTLKWLWVGQQNLVSGYQKRYLERSATVISNKRMVTFIGDAGLLNAPVGGVRDQMRFCVNTFTWRRLKCHSLKMAGCCASRCSSWFHPTNTAVNSSIPVSLGSGVNLFYFATSPTDCTAWPQCVPRWGSTCTQAG